jgi:hypothetical protein
MNKRLVLLNPVSLVFNDFSNSSNKENQKGMMISSDGEFTIS